MDYSKNILVWPHLKSKDENKKQLDRRTEGGEGTKKRNNTGERKKGGNKMDFKVQSVTVLPAAHRNRGEIQGSCRQYSEQELHWRFGGACMHKTDGKLFCVAAPIPGAGAGGGEWVRRSMRWEAAQGKPNAPH